MKDKDTYLLQEQYQKLFKEEEIFDKHSHSLRIALYDSFDEFYDWVDGISYDQKHVNAIENALKEWYDSYKNSSLTSKEKIHQIIYDENGGFRWDAFEEIYFEEMAPVLHNVSEYFYTRMLYNPTKFLTDEDADKLLEQVNQLVEKYL